MPKRSKYTYKKMDNWMRTTTQPIIFREYETKKVSYPVFGDWFKSIASFPKGASNKDKYLARRKLRIRRVK